LEFSLKKFWVPNDKANNFQDFSKESTLPQCHIFISETFPSNKKLLLLIQGTGAVRAGY
jgi:hypothetical protein